MINSQLIAIILSIILLVLSEKYFGDNIAVVQNANFQR